MRSQNVGAFSFVGSPLSRDAGLPAQQVGGIDDILVTEPSAARSRFGLIAV